MIPMLDDSTPDRERSQQKRSPLWYSELLVSSKAALVLCGVRTRLVTDRLISGLNLPPFDNVCLWSNSALVPVR